ncbi:MAG: cysteine dioxygenase family protein [bacterium]|nr:cysteine dioxygenase family protein [bacterium]
MRPCKDQSPALTELAEVIRRSLAGAASAQASSERVAAILPRFLAKPNLLLERQRTTDPARYLQHVAHVEPDGSFSIVALAWLPGQETPIHDHVCWCAVGVYEGTEDETRYRLSRREDRSFRLMECGRTQHPAGSALACLPGDDIHRVANHGDGLAISIHVYGADISALGSSIYRCYNEATAPRARSSA